MAVFGIRRLLELVVRPFRGRAAVDAEIHFHLEAQIEELVGRGWDPAQARAEAEKRFGDLAQYREVLVTIDHRNRWMGEVRRWLADLWDDVRYATRGLVRTPSFTGGVALTLALGLGMTATMVGLMDRLLFKPPAHVASPERVVRYTLTQTTETFGAFTNQSVTWKEVLLLRQAHSIDGLAAFASGSGSLGRGGQARRVPFMAVTPNYFSVLGVGPIAGRFFGPNEDPVDGSAAIAIISYRMWTRDFGRSPSAVGTQLWLGPNRLTIVGVAPEYFNGIDLDANDLWLPFHTGALQLAGPGREWEDTWDWQWVEILARLKPGVSRTVASAEATAIYRAAVAGVPGRQNDHGQATYHPVIAGRGAGEGKEPTVAALLAGVSLLLLLITCANVANLLLARGLARGREIAVRLALGVGRARLVRMLLVESGLLSSVGAAGGIGLAYVGSELTRRWFLPNIDFVDPPVDGRLLAAMVAIAAMTALVIGLIPAVRMSRPNLAAELKAGSPGQSASRRHQQTRRTLLVVQGTLSVVMLVAAGLFVRSFARVSAIDFGFDASGVVAADIDLGVAGYPDAQRHSYYRDLHERLKTHPGVLSVSLATSNPFYTRSSTRITMPGGDSVPHLKSGGPFYSSITPEYFTTLRIGLRRGRVFTDRDGEGGPFVMIVNETMARTFWPGKSALGECLFIGRDSKICRTVVGIVADANSETLDRDLVQAYYIPLRQSADLNRDRYLLIRVAGDPVAAIPGIRTLMQTQAPNLPVASVRLLASQMDRLYRPWRLGAALFGAMGVVALAVVLVGLYSVLSYGVAQRRREFGIRTALGASNWEVSRLVVGEGQRVVGLGILLGIGVTLALGPLMQRFLFMTEARDPLVYGAVVILLVAAAAIGSFVPARRASRSDPMTALRAD